MIPLEFMSKPPYIMPTRYDFRMQFEVVITKLQTCIMNEQQLRVDAMVYFTDTSKMDAGVRVGVTGPNLKLSYSLRKSFTIYQAKMLALESCV